MKDCCIPAYGGQLFVRSRAKTAHSVPVWSGGNIACLWFYHTQIATTTSPHENQSYYARERPVQISAGHSFVSRFQSQRYDDPQRITAKIFLLKRGTWTLDDCFVVVETIAHRPGELHGRAEGEHRRWPWLDIGCSEYNFWVFWTIVWWSDAENRPESKRCGGVEAQSRKSRVRRDGPHYHFFRDGRAVPVVVLSMDTVLPAVVPRGFQLV